MTFLESDDFAAPMLVLYLLSIGIAWLVAPGNA
jgi:hypothetical protein